MSDDPSDVVEQYRQIGRAAHIDSFSPVPVQRAPEVRIVETPGGRVGATPPGVERARQIGEEGPAIEPPKPPPVPPTEQELRTALKLAIEAQQAANVRLASAMEASERGKRKLANVAVRASDFQDVEKAIVEATVAAMRAGDEAEVPQALLDQRKARDLAMADRYAAEAALAILTADLAQAQADATQAKRATDGAIAGLLGLLQAGPLAARHESLMDEARALRRRLAGFDRYCTGVAPLPGSVVMLLRSHPDTPRGPVDVSAWRTAAEALRADPDARIEITVEEQAAPVEIRQSWPPPGSRVERAIPIEEPAG
jgi:hypothetical protein